MTSGVVIGRMGGPGGSTALIVFLSVDGRPRGIQSKGIP